MILVADSGSTKTDWMIASPDVDYSFQTIGLNPFFVTEEQIHDVLSDVKRHFKGQHITQFCFFGAGYLMEADKNRVRDIAKGLFPYLTHIMVDSDLIGAAIALFGKEKGIVSILGTGASSAVYNGCSFDHKAISYGFLLGDLGSGASLGLHLLRTYLKGTFSKPLAEKFEEKLQLTTHQLLQKVYREPRPNQFLASLSPFLLENKRDRQINAILQEQLGEYVDYFIRPFISYADNVGIVGSIAFAYQDYLVPIIRQMGIEHITILKRPIEHLALHYAKQ